MCYKVFLLWTPVNIILVLILFDSIISYCYAHLIWFDHLILLCSSYLIRSSHIAMLILFDSIISYCYAHLIWFDHLILLYQGTVIYREEFMFSECLQLLHSSTEFILLTSVCAVKWRLTYFTCVGNQRRLL